MKKCPEADHTKKSLPPETTECGPVHFRGREKLSVLRTPPLLFVTAVKSPNRRCGCILKEIEQQRQAKRAQRICHRRLKLENTIRVPADAKNPNDTNSGQAELPDNIAQLAGKEIVVRTCLFERDHLATAARASAASRVARGLAVLATAK